MSPLFHYITRALAAASVFLSAHAQAAKDERQPNILWITMEDHGPHLGAYGDEYAHTPHMDAFAARSLRYDVAWSDAPVCAPARTAIITGVYPTSTGGQHMRSEVRLPSFLQKYPQLLRAGGYYCTNNAKEDYNVTVEGKVWDESSRQAHYRNRPEGQPFFAIFNLNESHESRLRDQVDLPHHDPAKAPIPPYHPDTPEVRRDWAQYYNSLTNVDARVGELLAELKAEGLSEDTIVFVYSDHGSGMPRHKRWPYNSGLQVASMVHVPERFRHLAPADYAPGGHTRRPIAFVDLAPTLLSLAGMEPPAWMQGKAFMGPHEAEPRTHLFGFRGRMDERVDMVRSVRNDRYIYVRNYMPHLIYGQYLAYMFETTTTRIWQHLYEAGELVPPQTAFWEPKPAEELYDLSSDPHEVNNLVDSSQHQAVLTELREAHRQHVLSVRDIGFLPEAEMHRRAGEMTIYQMARDQKLYPLERLAEIADLAARRDTETVPNLLQAINDPDPAVRYWAILGLGIRGNGAFQAGREKLLQALGDENPSVRIAAAGVLLNSGEESSRNHTVDTLMELAPPDRNGVYVAMAAMSLISDLSATELQRLKPLLENMPVQDPNAPARPNNYVQRQVRTALAKLENL